MTGAVSELTGLEQALLRHLYRLRLLTTSQARELAAADRRVVQQRLRRLATAGLIAEVQGPPPGRERRWFCTEAGRAAAEAGREVNPRRYQFNEAAARSAGHLIGVNAVGVALTRWARRYGDEVAWELEVGHAYSRTQAVIADAVLAYTLTTLGGEVVDLRRFIEYDRGTEPGHILVDKLRGYVEVAGYRPPPEDGQAHRPAIGWQRRYPTFPHVLFVFGDMTDQEAQGRLGRLIGDVGSDPFLTTHGRAVTVHATTLDELQRSDPFTDDIITRVPHGERRPLHSRR